MSKFSDDFAAALEKVAVGNAGDPETKAAVEQIKQQLAADEATQGELEDAVLALTNKLANSTPTPPVVTGGAASGDAGAGTGGQAA